MSDDVHDIESCLFLGYNTSKDISRHPFLTSLQCYTFILNIVKCIPPKLRRSDSLMLHEPFHINANNDL